MSHYPITDQDRALIDTWTHHGIPTNDSTLTYAARLLTRLLAAYDHLAEWERQK